MHWGLRNRSCDWTRQLDPRTLWRHDPAVSLSQLRYFVAVAEEGNVGRAAQRLHVAQPPLSRQIRALEDELGAALFERTPKGMKLLAPGEVLLDHARAILAAVDGAVVATRSSVSVTRPGAARGSSTA